MQEEYQGVYINNNDLVVIPAYKTQKLLIYPHSKILKKYGIHRTSTNRNCFLKYFTIECKCIDSLSLLFPFFH